MSDITLPDPGLSDRDLNQLNYKLFHATGMSWVFYGPGTLDDLFDDLSRQVPAFLSGTAAPNGIGWFGGQENMMWTASEGPDGAAISVFPFNTADIDFLFNELVLPTDSLPSPWTRGAGTVGAFVEEPIAAVYANAVTKPIWELGGLEHLRP